MSTIDDEARKVLEALKIGLELEAHGIRFYTEAADEVKDPKGRQTLRYLANEEREHQRFIRELRKSFEEGDETALKAAADTHLARHAASVFPELEDYVEEIKERQGDKKILEEAREIEKKSVSLYEEALEGVSSKEAQGVFTTLISEEKGHLKLIEQMADYMTLHGVWSGLEDYFVNE